MFLSVNIADIAELIAAFVCACCITVYYALFSTPGIKLCILYMQFVVGVWIVLFYTDVTSSLFVYVYDCAKLAVHSYS